MIHQIQNRTIQTLVYVVINWEVHRLLRTSSSKLNIDPRMLKIVLYVSLLSLRFIGIDHIGFVYFREFIHNCFPPVNGFQIRSNSTLLG